MKKLFSKIKNGFKGLIKEFKIIRWCKFNEWMKASLAVIVVSSVLALLLGGFDKLSNIFVNFVGGLF